MESRVIVHFDCDAFYAQCEEVRDPRLRTAPLGVTQKYLIVTSNYPARQRGVAKLMSIKEAQQQCPELVLINGEDLTPYRKASKRVLAVLQRFGVAEKLGMDEVLLDVTQEVEARLARGNIPPAWSGHVHNSKTGVIQENRHRVMDLRANTLCNAQLMGPSQQPEHADGSNEWTARLMVGSQIASEARAAMKAETGFRSSAGISCNRMLAKLSSGLHKPDDQTVLRPCQAADFVAPLPLRAIPGVGYKLGLELKELGLQKVEDLRNQDSQAMIAKFGERTARFLQDACYGLDSAPVKPKQPAKSVTVEDSFKSCTTPQAARHVLKILVPDLLARLKEEFEDEGRRPKTLTLKWRHKGNGWSRNSASCPLPASIQVQKGAEGEQCEVLLKSAGSLFSRNVQQPFNITLFNLGATNFVERQASGSVSTALTKFLVGPQDQEKSAAQNAQSSSGVRAADRFTMKRRDYGANPSGLPISKTQERMLREGGKLDGRPHDKREVNLPSVEAAPHGGRLDEGLQSQPEMAAECSRSAEDAMSVPPVSSRIDDDLREGHCASVYLPVAKSQAVTFTVEERIALGPGQRLQGSQLASGPPALPSQAREDAPPSSSACRPDLLRGQAGSHSVENPPSIGGAGVLEDQNRDDAGAKSRPQQMQKQRSQTVSELHKLRTLLSQAPTEVGQDADAALAWKLQAEELKVVDRAPPQTKRKTGTLDGFFACPRSQRTKKGMH